MKKYVIILSLVALSFAGNVRAEDQGLVRTHYAAGHKFLSEKNYAGALEEFRKIKTVATPIADYIAYGEAKSLWGLKRCAESREAFKNIVILFPQSRWADVAKQQAASAGDCPPLEGSSEREAQTPDCAAITDDADRAQCWFDARDYVRAKDVYKTLPPTTLFLTRLSQSAARSQDFETAIAANQKIAVMEPMSPESREAQRRIAFLYQDSGDYAAAIKPLDDLILTAKKPDERRKLLEKKGWCLYRLGRYQDAVASFDEVLQGDRSPFALYWKAVALEKSGQKKSADALFRQILEDNPRSYYALRAGHRLQKTFLGDWWPPIAKGLQWSSERVSVQTTATVPKPRKKHQKRESSAAPLEFALLWDRIHELTAMGQTEDATVELRRARILTPEKNLMDPKQLLRRGRTYVYDLLRPHEENPEYRLPYADHLNSLFHAAKIAVLDPFFVFGLMRQESRFRENIVSPVGAIGLLQIMPYTGRRLAREEGWNEFHTEWLYDPLTNIQLAVAYVRKLEKEFSGKWYAIAASYNAGEQVVGQWLKQRPNHSEEEFIEEIPYAETRDYVKKIYVNWMAYKTIYKKIPS
jgi:soluble lytic murein transglycosylase-like protein/outer membrane protein assembly factor BamD (BamD/ComL family)